jgi:hypothetical protein
MSSQAENLGAPAPSSTGAEINALLNLTHGICSCAELNPLTPRDLERIHDMAQRLVKLTAALLTDASQRRLPL